ncbi:hypothetical protein RFI_13393 [Reticulomyxa filosa]|uniref:DNA mismatch repair protein MutS core domain-containing protein n=1 Tax=Reticulomyxa filosa TaxID=46433 RepID=X6ND12_RETFI|nr:hypothetical protein RFI_13393 [Reticulomyxa filosa]|eukprot:ETO23783.1 hypothetical protein RFI_13393 [Reticulomyxa filosa]
MLYQYTDKASYPNTLILMNSLMPDQIIYPSKGYNSTLMEKLKQHLQMTRFVPLLRKHFNESEGHNCLKEICTEQSLLQVSLDSSMLDQTIFFSFVLLSQEKYTQVKLKKKGIWQQQQHQLAFVTMKYTMVVYSVQKVSGYYYFTFFNILYLHRKLRFESIDGFVKLDPATIKNLELVTNLESPKSPAGTLLSVIDHCNSPLGKRLLRSNLHQPINDIETLSSFWFAFFNARLDAVTEIANNESLFYHLNDRFKNLPDIEVVCSQLGMYTLYCVANFLIYLQQVFVFLLELRQCLTQARFFNQALQDCKCQLLQYLKNATAKREFEEATELIDKMVEPSITWNPKNYIELQKIDLASVLKTGINGLLDVARALHLEIFLFGVFFDYLSLIIKNRGQNNIFPQFIYILKEYPQWHRPGMQLHFNETRGYHISIPITDKAPLPGVIYYHFCCLFFSKLK